MQHCMQVTDWTGDEHGLKKVERKQLKIQHK